MPDYDLVVLGAGPAGEKGAAQAAYYGKRVAIVEHAPYVGGAAINTGTVPSKTLRETALYFSGLRQRGLYGIDYSLREGLTVKDFMHREQVVVEQQRETIRQNLERHKIEIAWGTGTIVDPHTVRVQTDTGETRDMSAEFILIATGSSPYHPPAIPFDSVRIYDSDSILRMPFIPQTMAVVGGGVIGSEYASVFTALGVQVTLIEARDRLLPAIDHEIAQRLQAQLESLGLRFVFSDQVTSVAVSADHVQLQLQNSGRMECDIALFASGRQSNIQGLGLEALGVALGGRGLIRVNEHYQTNVPSIYAAGDGELATPTNERLALQRGVRQVVLPRPGRKSPARLAHERQRWFRRGRNWRAGIEGRISALKRRHGLDWCPYHGDAGMERWIGWGVIAHDLRTIAQHQATKATCLR
jgi:NAD(P) transhydrogenase